MTFIFFKRTNCHYELTRRKFMKRLFISALIAAFFSSNASAKTTEQSIQSHQQLVESSYQQALAGAIEIQKAVQTFLQNPSELTLNNAKTIWTESRKAYSQTEVFRFSDGPIDNEVGPEPRINSWPLDEAYIDYVAGDAKAGFINNTQAFPQITKELLTDLNTKDGEANISTGYHAIEFMLWGQDLNPNGAGKRSFDDYIVGKRTNADRRKTYLSLIAEMLVEDLQSVHQQWVLQSENTYGRSFIDPVNAKESLKKILTGTIRLAGEELSQERMFVAYDTQQQEDEHSCFSDTTLNDLFYNLKGISNVVNTSILSLVEQYDADLAHSINLKLEEAQQNMISIKGPFDQAILLEGPRTHILATINSLEELSALLKQASKLLGVEVP